MSALTVHQPFASGLVKRRKHWENRVWPLKLPTTGRGRWLALHAGAKTVNRKTTKHAAAFAALRAAWPAMPGAGLPNQAVLGYIHVCRVVRVHQLTAIDRRDPQAVGPWCWEVDKVVEIASPVGGVPGQRGLWKPPADTMSLEDARALQQPPPQQQSEPFAGARGSGTHVVNLIKQAATGTSVHAWVDKDNPQLLKHYFEEYAFVPGERAPPPSHAHTPYPSLLSGQRTLSVSVCACVCPTTNNDLTHPPRPIRSWRGHGL